MLIEQEATAITSRKTLWLNVTSDFLCSRILAMKRLFKQTNHYLELNKIIDV